MSTQDIYENVEAWIQRSKPGMKLLGRIRRLLGILINPDASAWAKGIAVAALVYVLTPFDCLPDMLPGGLADDLLTLVTALSRIDVRIRRHRC